MYSYIWGIEEEKIKNANFLILFSMALNFGTLHTNGSTIIDQFWERPEPYVSGGSSSSIFLGQSIGQEFTPTMDSIVAVELAISADYLNMNPGEIQPITVIIRENVINGNALTTSTILSVVDDDFIELLSNDPYFVWLYFDFGEEISVIPDSRYVIEVSMPELGALNWMWDAWEDTYNVGIPGYRITSGERQETGYPTSFGFRTYAIPEPATIALLSLGGLLLRKRKS